MKESEISKIEKGIKKEEKELREEVKKEGKGLAWFFKSQTFKIFLTLIIFAVLVFGIIYFADSKEKIYIENSQISAPVITLSPAIPGILQNVFVKENDFIPAGTTVAMVGNIPIKSQIAGLVIYVQNTPGQLVNSQTPVVQMIDVKQLRVIGHIEEDKGLAKIRPGQKVIFTVDAFGSKQYSGVVESVAPSPDTSDIVFSISNNRQEQSYDIKVNYDLNAYPELQQGMSAKMWVYI
jgi:multidrug resistance efflux pump